MSLRAMIKQSCGGSDNTSSKRILMYWFSFAATFMILIQAAFTLILIYKWANAVADAEGHFPEFEIYSVFPDVIWYCVFGCITGLAGINGFGKQPKTETPSTPPSEEEVH